jgi:hypothetical protein
MRVIDRSYMGLKELALTDFKIYLGDIFILDYFRGIYRLDITRGQHIVITGHYEGESFTRFAIYPNDLDEQVLIAVANQHAVYEAIYAIACREVFADATQSCAKHHHRLEIFDSPSLFKCLKWG